MNMKAPINNKARLSKHTVHDMRRMQRHGSAFDRWVYKGAILIRLYGRNAISNTNNEQGC